MEEKDFITPDTENQSINSCQAQAEASEEGATSEEQEFCNQEEVPAELTDTDKLALAEAEIAQLKDQVLRQAAEFENMRKRNIQTQADLILNGGKKVLESLLPILDDMERAAEHMSKSDDVAALREGLNLVQQKLIRTLEQQGLKRIDTTNALFDTDFHEAIAMLPTDDADQKGKVMDCVQAGYTLNDKVIRHAKVAVGQ